MLRVLIAVLATLAPQSIKHVIYRNLFGWNIHPSARIGVSFILVDRLVVEAEVTIGHANVIKGCELVHLSTGATIGYFNWISGPSRESGLYPLYPERKPHLMMGQYSSIVNRHLVDCSDQVTIGELSILAGNRSQIISHGYDVADGHTFVDSVSIGERSLVFAGTTIVAGSRVPDRCVIAAGAVVPKGLKDELRLYGGVPARPLRELSPEYRFFHRQPGDPGLHL